MMVMKLCAVLVGVATATLSPQATEKTEGAGAPARPPASQEAAGRSAESPAPRERPAPRAPRAEGDRLAELLESGDYVYLDVRRPDELEESGTVEGYINIPIDELADRLDEVPRDRPVLTA